MGKPKQQVISRFFATKPKADDNPSTPAASTTTPSSSSSPSTNPKISATVSFSPTKRKLLSSHLTSTPKKPKLPPHTQNPISSPSLHQKFLDKLLEPSIEIPPSSTAQSSIPKKYTPLEQQVVELKNKYPDVLLMIEVGYKYRFFGEDAEIAARVLGIYAHMDHNFMTASVPTFRLNVHVRRLVSVGYKVGVVKQTETAAIKAHGENKGGPFCRGLSALYTKATLEAAEDAGGNEEACGGESNYLCCVVEKSILAENGGSGSENGLDVRVGFVAVEISTGDVVYDEFNDDFLRSRLEAVVLTLAPAELLLGALSKQTKKLLLAYAGPSSNVRVEHASGDCFTDGGALAEVTSLYENMGENSMAGNENQSMESAKEGNFHCAIEGVLNMPHLAVQALALTIRHLKQFGFERILCLRASFRPFSSNMEMNLSANTLQQLEVLKNNSNGSESGSLLHIMNHTLTISGFRLLRHWVAHPLCDRNMITARLHAVSEIAESMGSFRASQNVGKLDEENSDFAIVEPDLYHILSAVLTTLGRSPDIQRGITRIFHRTASASEFIAVIQAILNAGKQLQQLHLEDNNENVQAKNIHSALLRKLILTASSSVVGTAAKLLSSLNKEAAECGDLPNLLVTSNGQFPEVAKSREAVQLAKEKTDSLISSYRKQLKMHNLKFMSVSGVTHLIELPEDVKVPLNWVKVNSTKKTIRYHPPEVLAALDQLSLATEKLMVICRAAWDSFLKDFAKYYSEFQAVVHALAALDCLHSLATLSKNKNYICPVFLDDNEPVQIHISSGRHPVGSFVPASSAKLHVLDGIYTRMGASDSIQRGRSTFLEELSEASHILHKCTERSLVILDELGRGTSTHDGEAIAYATLHHMLEQKRCMVLFVTHYPKIASIKTDFPSSVGIYHVSYLTSEKSTTAMDSDFDNEDVTYLYKLVPGVSERSFGFKVAQLAQLPASCVKRAAVMASRLEVVVSCRVGNKLELLENRPSDEQEEKKNELYDGRIQIYGEITINDYEKFFLELRLARVERDPAKSLQLLENARRIAKALITRKGGDGH
ncbi:DNA mismatch repair protein MSH3 isoform X2 [Euphorbia lathyris]|uniref:DNA mismatch repair protein MSH3 isoform X2 n=1 Tax=Euphorbia lathyris TaxID=212925 RepID=UPI003313CF23